MRPASMRTSATPRSLPGVTTRAPQISMSLASSAICPDVMFISAPCPIHCGSCFSGVRSPPACRTTSPRRSRPRGRPTASCARSPVRARRSLQDVRPRLVPSCHLRGNLPQRRNGAVDVVYEKTTAAPTHARTAHRENTSRAITVYDSKYTARVNCRAGLHAAEMRQN